MLVTHRCGRNLKCSSLPECASACDTSRCVGSIALFTSLKLLVRLHFCGSQRVQGLVDRRRVSVSEVDAEGRTRKLQCNSFCAY